MEKGVARQSWWGRMSGRVKLILAAVIVIVIGLAVGLGVGLTVGSGGSSNGNPPSPSTTFSPVPSAGPAGLWQPAVNVSWQIVLLDPISLPTSASSVSPDVAVYDIDMFTNSKDTISTLKKLGKRVICYFSAGSYEPGRPDSAKFVDSDKGSELDGWPGEFWLNLKSENVRNIMKERIQYAVSQGCDAIDPDNVDGYVRFNHETCYYESMMLTLLPAEQ
jgi:hypothetical protein